MNRRDFLKAMAGATAGIAATHLVGRNTGDDHCASKDTVAVVENREMDVFNINGIMWSREMIEDSIIGVDLAKATEMSFSRSIARHEDALIMGGSGV